MTAGNASPLSDGAAALVLASAQRAAELGLTPLALVRGFADANLPPVDFPTAPAAAVPKALQRAGLSADDVDAWEINQVGVKAMCTDRGLLARASN